MALKILIGAACIAVILFVGYFLIQEKRRSDHAVLQRLLDKSDAINQEIDRRKKLGEW
jgi:low affinity Fe/Cu permease